MSDTRARAGTIRGDHPETADLRKRRASLPDRPLIERAAGFFRGMADPTRMRILTALEQQPTCVGDLCILLGVEQSAVSHQLRLLRELNLVSSERRGRHVVYSLQDEHVSRLVREAVAHAAHHGMQPGSTG